MITTTGFEKGEIARHLRDIGARRVLEIGAFKGETTRVLVDTLAEAGGSVVVIDPMSWSSEIVRNGIVRHTARFPRVLTTIERLLHRASYEPAFWQNVGGRERAGIHLYRSLSSDPRLLASSDPVLQSFDAVFVDGDHSYAGALLDLERWGGRVRDGGLVLVHDATPRFPGVVRAVEDWSRSTGLEAVWPTRDSLCVIRVRGALAERGLPVTHVNHAP
ncbi:MAG: class I SAM-dependent methyltransferase [Deltaproteobacteria bacterium]|nr:class I SAM-dependent methyltransferase [Deltaproteobacteria bacterium]